MTIAAFDPERALRVFVARDVKFVTIGGVASGAWGADVRFPVLEVCCERTASNHHALNQALDELEATVRRDPADGSSKVDLAMIETPDVLRLDTTAGAVNCVPSPHGTAGYSELIVNATGVSLGGDVIVHMASLDDLLRIARAENGPFRMADIEMLSVLKKQREREKL